MTAYVALLRAIGPVTHAAMPLGRLATACSAAGLETVRSIGNTGNLVFASPRPQAEVERLVGDAITGFGLANDVFTRTARQFRKLIDAAPFPDAAAERPAQLGVCFFHKDPSWPAAYLHYRGPERLTMLSNHLIIDYGGAASTSRLTVEKTVGARMTQRSWSSILRIAAALAAM